jgi:twitching motility protein PilJ
MPRMHTYSFAMQSVIFALATALIPICLMAALGMIPAISDATTLGRLLPLAGLVGAAMAAVSTFRVFTKQAHRIATLTAQLQYTPPPLTVHPNEASQKLDGVNNTLEQAIALFQAQEAHIATSTATMHELTASIEHMAEHVARSVTVAEQAVTHAQHGTMALHRILQGLQYMHLQVQDTAKRMQHLEEHTYAVSKIGQHIADLADHTGVLALNISVQTLRAGDMRQDSAVVAAEVEHLAGRTVTATQRIAHLVHTMQCETQEMITALETHANELTQWVEATHQAKQVWRDMEQTAVQLTELSHATSQAVAQQASISATLYEAMGEMSRVTQQTTAWTK